MICFFADNHYSVSPGKVIYEHLPAELREKIIFTEDDWSLLESGKWLDDCELLVLNMIGDTCNIPHPGPGAEKAVREWCERGGNILLLHGSSAAFWQWRWWRNLVDFRWVRPGDPDGVEPSFHPVHPYQVRVCKVRHGLQDKLYPLDLPSDEIYTNLEQMNPSVILMETSIAEGVFPQCTETVTRWGGKMVSFLPGHDPSVTSKPELIRNITVLMEYLMKGNTK